MKVYDVESVNIPTHDAEQRQKVKALLLPLLDDMSWVHEHKTFQFTDKVEILRKFKLRQIKAGERIS